jgi:hypothetical protein
MKTTVTIFGLILLIVAFLFIRTVLHNSRIVAKESSQRALVDETQSLLENYKSENGKYPETLAALPFTYPDGGSAELLKDIAYTCFGTAYTLRTVGYSSGQTIEINTRAEHSH